MNTANEYQSRINSNDEKTILEQLICSCESENVRKRIDDLALLIDYSGRYCNIGGLKLAVKRGDTLLDADIDSNDRSLVNYYLSNAWDFQRHLLKQGDDLEAWEHVEIEKSLIHLRKALRSLTENERILQVRRCQMFTNLGNLFRECGRGIEALEAYDDALEIDPKFGMALGNRGATLFHLVRFIHTDGYQIYYLREALASLANAVSEEALDFVHEEAKEAFQKKLKTIRSLISEEDQQAKPHTHEFTKRMLKSEIKYRLWCLEHRLFLNELNDIIRDPIAALDLATLPAIFSAGIGYKPPNCFRLFNQIKQEYVSARFLLYEGVSSTRVHFSDRDVILANTLDYPSLCFAVEKIKAAFKMVYSLLDKIAVFLNEYLKIGIPVYKVTFRGLWYSEQNSKCGLNPSIHKKDNTQLKALFWLSKELFEKGKGYAAVIEPDAEEIYELRNRLEHKFVHVYDDVYESLVGADQFSDLLKKISRQDLEQKTIRLFKVCRGAILYLEKSIYVEESRKNNTADNDTIHFPLTIESWDDNWKR